MARRAVSKASAKKSAAQFQAADFFVPPTPKTRAALALPAPLPLDMDAALHDLHGIIAEKHKRLLVLVHLLPCWRCLGTVENGGHHSEDCPLFWHSTYRDMLAFKTLNHQNKKRAREMAL